MLPEMVGWERLKVKLWFRGDSFNLGVTGESWRKPGVEFENKRTSGQVHRGDDTGEQEASRSLKLPAPTVASEKAKKQLNFSNSERLEKELQVNAGLLLPESASAQHGYPEKPSMHGLSDGTSIMEEGFVTAVEDMMGGGGVEFQVKKSRRKTFKRLIRLKRIYNF
jgi:hypothetical protein